MSPSNERLALLMRGAQFRKISESVAVEAVIHRRGFVERHSAEAATKWTTLMVLKVGPLAHAHILRHPILVISNDLERISVPWNKTLSLFQFAEDNIL